jgi:hypothetical protein
MAGYYHWRQLCRGGEMQRLNLVVAVLVVSGTAFVSAHHSYADFDQDRSVSIEGTIDKVLFANPHVVLTVRMNDSTVYTMTWASATQLNRQGVGRADLKVGDKVIVSGSPSRKSPELSRISEVSRSTDGWRWRKAGGRVDVNQFR